MQTQQAIPLNKLVLSPLNTRQTQEGDDVSDLLPLIRRQGLLQRLVVVPPSGKDKRFGVVAGGRRLLCLQTLAGEGAIGKKSAIDCLVIPPDAGIAASIAENSARKNLHPADEFLAFRSLVESGTPVEDVAATFGVTPLVVQRRLKLSSVSARLLDEYRRDEMTLDQVMALAITDDHAAQEAAWFDVPEWNRQPHAIRRALTQGEPDASTDRRVAFVGLDAYKAAGGALRHDLFAENDGYVLDVALLERLVRDKMAERADALKAQGWGTVHTVASGQGLNLNFECVRVRPSTRDLTEDEAAEEERIAARIGEIDERLDSEDEEPVTDWQELDTEREKLEIQLDDLQASRRVWTDEQKAQGGAVLSLDEDGNLRCDLGVVPRTEATKHLDNDDAVAPGVRPKPERAAHSERLVAQLTAHRSAAMMATLADNPHAALVALLATMLPRVFGFHVAETGLRITLSPSVDSLKQKAEDLVETKALARLSDIHTDWNTRLSFAEGGSEDERDNDPTIDWLLAQDTTALLQLLAYCVAASLDLTSASEKERRAAAFASAVGIDMRQWWAPTAKGYFAHVAKPQILAALKEAGCETPASLSSLKKDALAITAEQAITGKGWLPAMLR